MEKGAAGENNKCLVCLYEAIGTCVLVAALNISGGKPEALGIALFMGVLAFSKVSGSHLNPAVTLGIFVKERDFTKILYLLMMWASQIIGAVGGLAVAYSTSTWNKLGLPKPGIARLCPNHHFTATYNGT